MIDYHSLDGYIWQDTYKSIIYDYMQSDGQEAIFSKFIKMVSGTDTDKFKSAIGFALQRYKTRLNNRALFLTDKKASASDEESDVKSTGRTGKGLITQCLEVFRELGEIPGRKLSDDDRFLFSSYQNGQSLYVIQDIKPSFRMESIYNYITDKFIIEKKGKDKEMIDFEKAPKMILTANAYPKGMDCESTLGRLCILELENKFNSKYSPLDEFGCEFFSADWNDAEWARFFAYIVECIQYYLNHGLITENSKTISDKIQESGQSVIVREFLYDKYEDSKCKADNTHTVKSLWIDFMNDPKKYLNRCGQNKSKIWFSKALRKFPFLEFCRESDARKVIIHNPEDPSTWVTDENQSPF